MGYEHTIPHGRSASSGKPKPFAVNDDGELLLANAGGDSSTPAREPLIATLLLTSSEADLSTAAPDGAELSQAGWRLIVPAGGAGVLWGKAGAAVVPVLAGEDDVIPSASLSGWIAKSDGANVTVTLVGAKDV